MITKDVYGLRVWLGCDVGVECMKNGAANIIKPCLCEAAPFEGFVHVVGTVYGK